MVTAESTAGSTNLIRVRSLLDFESLIKGCGFELVIAYFFSKGSSAHKVINSQLPAVSAKLVGCRWLLVDADELKDLAERVNVRVRPTFLIFRHGSKVCELQGVGLTQVLEALTTHSSPSRVEIASSPVKPMKSVPEPSLPIQARLPSSSATSTSSASGLQRPPSAPSAIPPLPALSCTLEERVDDDAELQRALALSLPRPSASVAVPTASDVPTTASLSAPVPLVLHRKDGSPFPSSFHANTPIAVAADHGIHIELSACQTSTAPLSHLLYSCASSTDAHELVELSQEPRFKVQGIPVSFADARLLVVPCVVAGALPADVTPDTLVEIVARILNVRLRCLHSAASAAPTNLFLCNSQHDAAELCEHPFFAVRGKAARIRFLPYLSHSTATSNTPSTSASPAPAAPLAHATSVATSSSASLASSSPPPPVAAAPSPKPAVSAPSAPASTPAAPSTRMNSAMVAPPSRRKYTLRIFHDAENCPIPDDCQIAGDVLYHSVVRRVLVAVAGPDVAAQLDTVTDAVVNWSIYLGSIRTRWSPSAQTLEQLFDLGVRKIDCGLKKGAVDTFMKSDLQRFLISELPSSDRSAYTVVLITGDRDFSSDIVQLRQHGVCVVLVHRGGDTRLSMLSTLPERYSCPDWTTLVHNARLPQPLPTHPSSALPSAPPPPPQGAAASAAPVLPAPALASPLSQHVAYQKGLNAAQYSALQPCGVLEKLRRLEETSPALHVVLPQRPEPGTRTYVVELWVDGGGAVPDKAVVDGAVAAMARILDNLCEDAPVEVEGVRPDELLCLIASHPVLSALCLRHAVHACVLGHESRAAIATARPAAAPVKVFMRGCPVAWPTAHIQEYVRQNYDVMVVEAHDKVHPAIATPRFKSVVLTVAPNTASHLVQRLLDAQPRLVVGCLVSFDKHRPAAAAAQPKPLQPPPPQAAASPSLGSKEPQQPAAAVVPLQGDGRGCSWAVLVYERGNEAGRDAVREAVLSLARVDVQLAVEEHKLLLLAHAKSVAHYLASLPVHMSLPVRDSAASTASVASSVSPLALATVAQVELRGSRGDVTKAAEWLSSLIAQVRVLKWSLPRDKANEVVVRAVVQVLERSGVPVCADVVHAASQPRQPQGQHKGDKKRDPSPSSMPSGRGSSSGSTSSSKAQRTSTSPSRPAPQPSRTEASTSTSLPPALQNHSAQDNAVEPGHGTGAVVVHLVSKAPPPFPNWTGSAPTAAGPDTTVVVVVVSLPDAAKAADVILGKIKATVEDLVCVSVKLPATTHTLALRQAPEARSKLAADYSLASVSLLVDDSGAADLLQLWGPAEQVKLAAEYVACLAAGADNTARVVNAPDTRVATVIRAAPNQGRLKALCDAVGAVHAAVKVRPAGVRASGAVVAHLHGPQSAVVHAEGAMVAAVQTVALKMASTSMPLLLVEVAALQAADLLRDLTDLFGVDAVYFEEAHGGGGDVWEAARAAMGGVVVRIVCGDWMRCPTAAVVNTATSRKSLLTTPIAAAAGLTMVGEVSALGLQTFGEVEATFAYELQDKYGYMAIVHALTLTCTTANAQELAQVRRAVGGILDAAVLQGLPSLTLPPLDVGQRLGTTEYNLVRQAVVTGVAEWCIARGASSSVREVLLVELDRRVVHTAADTLTQLATAAAGSGAAGGGRQCSGSGAVGGDAAAVFQWSWMHPDGDFFPYDAKHNLLIDSAFRSGRTSVVILTDFLADLRSTAADVSLLCEVDLDRMLQISLATGHTTHVSRTAISPLTFPTCNNANTIPSSSTFASAVSSASSVQRSAGSQVSDCGVGLELFGYPDQIRTASDHVRDLVSSLWAHSNRIPLDSMKLSVSTAVPAIHATLQDLGVRMTIVASSPHPELVVHALSSDALRAATEAVQAKVTVADAGGDLFEFRYPDEWTSAIGGASAASTGAGGSCGVGTLVSLPCGCEEWRNVAAIFQRQSAAKLLHVDRIENVALWRRYFETRWSIAQENGGDPNEMLLLHPVPRQASASAPAVTVSPSGVFGRAVYFYPDVALCMRYMASQYHSAPSTTMHVLLAKVAVGNPDLRSSPAVLTQPAAGRHSVCGTGLVGTTVAVYELAQAYPAYLITYSL